MKLAVLGLWHLGCVTAACLADAGHQVVAIDDNQEVVAALADGRPPIYEPGLAELIASAADSGTLTFSTDLKQVRGADIVWVAYDTPVDHDDRADVDFVESKILEALPFTKAGTIILISSQLPAGFTRRLAEKCRSRNRSQQLYFAYSPENLRLGRAIQVFKVPERIVVGLEGALDLRESEDENGGAIEVRGRLNELLSPFTENIIWMKLESAEMTKHALNAFFALSISFINEIGVICEQVGADAKEVELGLKSEERIGQKAYVSPGGAFAGGTLARDVAFLTETARHNQVPSPLIAAIRESNEEHKRWAARRLKQRLSDLDGKVIAVLGLTYKPGTDTLRRSSSVELCQWLAGQGSIVKAHDPVVTSLPADLNQQIALKGTAEEALTGANALVVATEWPQFKELSASQLIRLMTAPLVLDAGGFLRKNLSGEREIDYLAVGKP